MRLAGVVSWRGFVLESSPAALCVGAHSISSVQLGRGGGGNLRVSYSDSFSFASGVGSNASEMRSGKG